MAAVAVLAERVDGLLSAGWPNFHDDYIVKPRGLTRLGVPLTEDEYFLAPEEEETDR